VSARRRTHRCHQFLDFHWPIGASHKLRERADQLDSAVLVRADLRAKQLQRDWR
jgi:hypothetical protein